MTGRKQDVAEPIPEPVPEGLDLLDRRLAYTLFRLALGVSLLLHGVTADLHPGGGGVVLPRFEMEHPVLAPAAAAYVDTVTTLLTTGLGLLLTLGLWTRGALLVGAALATALVVGNAYRTDVQALTVQMMCLALFYLLPPAAHYNVYSADALLQKFSRGEPRSRAGDRPSVRPRTDRFTD